MLYSLARRVEMTRLTGKCGLIACSKSSFMLAVMAGDLSYSLLQPVFWSWCSSLANPVKVVVAVDGYHWTFVRNKRMNALPSFQVNTMRCIAGYFFAPDDAKGKALRMNSTAVHQDLGNSIGRYAPLLHAHRCMCAYCWFLAWL